MDGDDSRGTDGAKTYAAIVIGLATHWARAFRPTTLGIPVTIWWTPTSDSNDNHPANLPFSNESA